MQLIEWFTEERTAEMLGVTTRTVRRMAAGGALRRAWRPVQGRKPEAVYHPEDVEREHAKARPRPVPVPDPRDIDSVTQAPPPAIALRVTQAIEQMAAARVEPQVAGRMADALDRLASARADTSADIPEMLARLAEIVRRAPRAPSLWLTVEQASEYSGLSQALLRRLIEAKKLYAFRDRSLKVRRGDLEKLKPV